MAQIKSYFMTLKYGGICKGCGCRIEKGAKGWFLKGTGIRCEKCGHFPDHPFKDPSEPKRGGKRGGQNPAPPAPYVPTPTRTEDDTGTVRVHYDSITECVKEALDESKASSESQCAYIKMHLDGALNGFSDWANKYTKETFMERLSTPDRNMVSRISDMKDLIVGDMQIVQGRRRKWRRGVEDGDELNVDRFVVRDPECWDRIEKVAQPKRCIRIAINSSASASQTNEVTLWRGAAALTLSDILQERGYSVEVTQFMTTCNTTDTCKRSQVSVTVKRSDMPLDIGALSFALCDIGYMRIALIHSMVRNLPGVILEGWGQPTPLSVMEQKGFDYVVDLGVRDQDTAAKWILAQQKGLP